MEFTTEQLVTTYLKIRDAIAERERQCREDVKLLEAQKDVVEQELLAVCESVGGNVSTPVGSVRRRIAKQYWTSDWDALYQTIKDNNAFHLLHQRISQKAMQQFLEENPDVHPAGLNVDSKYTVTVVRK
jgi:hypothetical protein